MELSVTMIDVVHCSYLFWQAIIDQLVLY